jgi:hypothetical protein
MGFTELMLAPIFKDPTDVEMSEGETAWTSMLNQHKSLSVNRALALCIWNEPNTFHSDSQSNSLDNKQLNWGTGKMQIQNQRNI